jgi:hypothetical protein
MMILLKNTLVETALRTYSENVVESKTDVCWPAASG